MTLLKKIKHWLLGKSTNRNPKKTYRRLIYRAGGRTYWKGRPIDDDIFQSDPKALNEYKQYVKKRNKQIIKKNIIIAKRNKYLRRRRRK